jgi:predicted phosphodiesterase
LKKDIKKKTSRELELLSESKKKFDENATPDDCINDLRAVQKKEPNRYITRQFYRIHGKYSDSTWSQHFGTFKEYRRQSELELTRQQHQLEQQIAKHAAHDHYREYYTTELLPYHDKFKKISDAIIKSMLIVSDIHDIECDRFALHVFIEECRRQQPDHIIFNGDIFDLYEFSMYTKDPRQYRIKERFDFVKNHIFKPIREACPRTQIDFVMGNHEYRLIRLLADKTPNVRILLSDVLGLSLSQIFGLDEFQINFVSKVDLAAYTKGNITSELRQNYKIYYDCFAVTHIQDFGFGMSGTNGHHHKLQISSDRNILRGPITWVQTPGLHALDAEYYDGLNKWNLGFNQVWINTVLKEVIQQPVLIHPSWAIVNGVIYKRNVD